MDVDMALRIFETEEQWNGDVKLMLVGNTMVTGQEQREDQEITLVLPKEIADALGDFHEGRLVRLYFAMKDESRGEANVP